MPNPLGSVNRMDIINNKENNNRNEDNDKLPPSSPFKKKRKHKKTARRSSSSSSSSRHRTRKEATKRKRDAILLLPLSALVIMVAIEIFTIERFFFPKQQQQQQQQQQHGIDVKSLAILQNNNEKSKTKSDSTTELSSSLNDRIASSLSNNSPPPKLRDPITIVLEALGLKNDQDLPNDLKQQLPTKEEVSNLYGDTPIILGLDTCQAFRDARPNSEAFIAPSGMFNTGTNLMYEYLHHNCHLPEKTKKYGTISRGMRFQVPWGKHTPPSYRLHHLSSDATDQLDQTAFLPIVVIKDPFTWMSSMCRHSYAAFWPHNPKVHCPNLVPLHPFEQTTPVTATANGGMGMNGNGEVIKNTDSVHVAVKYSGKSNQRTMYNSLAHVWNDWYGEWLNVTSYPFLVIRFEDLVFHAEYIVKEVCACAGGQMRAYDDRRGEHDVSEGFQYIENSAKLGQKVHEGASGFTTAMIKYGNEKVRTESLTDKDMEFAKSVLRKDIMDAFHYVMPS